MTHDIDDMAERIRVQGGRLTPQRQLLLDTLCELGDHVTAAELYERVHQLAPAIDRSTVYRSVNLFAELGLVRSSTVDGVAVYELASGEGIPHGHLVCRTCGCVVHLEPDITLRLAGNLRESYDFQLDVADLTVYGSCLECHETPGSGASTHTKVR